MTTSAHSRSLAGTSPLERVEDTGLRYLPPVPLKMDFRIGILGSGFIVNECHLVSYRRAGFNPVAIASRNRDHAAQVAVRHSISRAYETYENLLDDPTIEIL